MAEDLSDETWDALEESARLTENDRGLGMLLKMTRCHDLGLGQLFFPGEDLDIESQDDCEGNVQLDHETSTTEPREVERPPDDEHATPQMT